MTSPSSRQSPAGAASLRASEGPPGQTPGSLYCDPKWYDKAAFAKTEGQKDVDRHDGRHPLHKPLGETQSPVRRYSGAHSLGDLRGEIDPGNEHGSRKLWAGFKMMGLEPHEVDPLTDQTIKIHPKIPPGKAVMIAESRSKVWEGLRQARIRDLQEALGDMTEDDVRRYERTGDGIRRVVSEDLPPVNMEKGDFAAIQEKRLRKAQAVQERKATELAMEFLKEKKRQEDAEKKAAALEQRLKEDRRRKDDERRAKMNENAKKQERREQNIKKMREEREEWADGVLEASEAKLAKFRENRTKHFHAGALKERLDSAGARRHDAFLRARDQEEQLLAEIEARNEALDERLAIRREEIALQMQQRAMETEEKFHEKQAAVHRHKEEWAENKLAEHKEFMTKQNKTRKAGREELTKRSKTVGDRVRKEAEKHKSGWDKVQQQLNEKKDNTVGRHQEAADRVDNFLKPMGLKCCNDVHSHREVKDGTWKELQQRRWKELHASRDARAQALVFKVAERMDMQRAHDESNYELKRKQQDMIKETLSLRDRAEDGFIKIQCEPDERKVNKMMADLGFQMPTLPDAAAAEEEDKPAF